MSRVTVRRDHRKVCAGDLRTRVTLSNRAITQPGFGQTAFGENFPAPRIVWAMVKTVNGRVLFNGVDSDEALSHEITIRYDSTVTAETWVELADSTRLDIIDTQDLEERNEYLVLLCNARGTGEASKA